MVSGPPFFGASSAVNSMSASIDLKPRIAADGLLTVGRGSHDPEATDAMHQFTRLRAELTPVGRSETCFIAMQSPPFKEALAAAAATTYRRIIVQPHLLFHGQLFHEIKGEVERLAH